MDNNNMDDLKELVIYAQDIYATAKHGQRFCARMARQWFKQHSLNWADFVAHGIAASKVVAIGDELGIMVIETARRRVHGR